MIAAAQRVDEGRGALVLAQDRLDDLGPYRLAHLGVFVEHHVDRVDAAMQ